MKEKYQIGFTLIEIMIGILLLAGMIGLSYYSLNNMQKKVKSEYITNTNEVDINQLVQFLVKLGRTSTSCLKNPAGTPAGAISIECDTDATTNNKVRYIKLSGESKIRVQATTDKGATWAERQTFGGNGKYDITTFNLCSNSDMKNGACPIVPSALSLAYPPSATVSNRFFRFQIIATDGPNKPTYSVQSAFFVRNPAPDGVEYVAAPN